MPVNVRGTSRGHKGKWLVDITDSRIPKGRKKFTVGVDTDFDVRTAKQAEKLGHEKLIELLEQTRKREPSKADSKSAAPTVETFSAEWIEKHARASLHKDSGIDSQESILRIHVLPFVGGKRLDELTDEVIADHKSKWIKGGYPYLDQFGRQRKAKATSSSSTLNNRLTILSCMLKVAYDWRRIATLPCRIKLLPRDDQDEADFYDHETYERLVVASARLDPRYQAALLLGGDGGLRRGEILALRLEDIDFRAGHFFVRTSVYFKKEVGGIEGAPKGGKSKPVPSTPRLLAALKVCRHLRGEFVLYDDDNGRVTPKVLRKWIERIEVAAGLPKTGRLHVLRHSYASHLAMAGAPARAIQELCRHSSLEITQRYLHLSPNAKKQAVEMLVKSRAAGGVSVLETVPQLSPEGSKVG